MISLHPWKAKPKTQLSSSYLFFCKDFWWWFYSKPCTNINTTLTEDEFILTFTENACETKHISIYGLLGTPITHCITDRKVLPSKSDVPKYSSFSQHLTGELALILEVWVHLHALKKLIGIKGLCKTLHSRNWRNDIVGGFWWKHTILKTKPWFIGTKMVYLWGLLSLFFDAPPISSIV